MLIISNFYCRKTRFSPAETNAVKRNLFDNTWQWLLWKSRNALMLTGLNAFHVFWKKRCETLRRSERFHAFVWQIWNALNRSALTRFADMGKRIFSQKFTPWVCDYVVEGRTIYAMKLNKPRRSLLCKDIWQLMIILFKYTEKKCLKV